MVASIPTSQSLQQVEKPSCTICFEELVPPKSPTDIKIRALLCGHVFHDPCIDPWEITANRCPVCRTVINIPINAQKKDEGNPVVNLVMSVAGFVITIFSVAELCLTKVGQKEVNPSILAWPGLALGITLLRFYLPPTYRELIR